MKKRYIYSKSTDDVIARKADLMTQSMKAGNKALKIDKSIVLVRVVKDVKTVIVLPTKIKLRFVAVSRVMTYGLKFNATAIPDTDPVQYTFTNVYPWASFDQNVSPPTLTRYSFTDGAEFDYTTLVFKKEQALRLAQPDANYHGSTKYIMSDGSCVYYWPGTIFSYYYNVMYGSVNFNPLTVYYGASDGVAPTRVDYDGGALTTSYTTVRQAVVFKETVTTDPSYPLGYETTVIRRYMYYDTGSASWTRVYDAYKDPAGTVRTRYADVNTIFINGYVVGNFVLHPDGTKAAVMPTGGGSDYYYNVDPVVYQVTLNATYNTLTFSAPTPVLTASLGLTYGSYRPAYTQSYLWTQWDSDAPTNSTLSFPVTCTDPSYNSTQVVTGTSTYDFTRHKQQSTSPSSVSETIASINKIFYGPDGTLQFIWTKYTETYFYNSSTNSYVTGTVNYQYSPAADTTPATGVTCTGSVYLSQKTVNTTSTTTFVYDEGTHVTVEHYHSVHGLIDSYEYDRHKTSGTETTVQNYSFIVTYNSSGSATSTSGNNTFDRTGSLITASRTVTLYTPSDQSRNGLHCMVKRDSLSTTTKTYNPSSDDTVVDSTVTTQPFILRNGVKDVIDTIVSTTQTTSSVAASNSTVTPITSSSTSNLPPYATSQTDENYNSTELTGSYPAPLITGTSSSLAVYKFGSADELIAVAWPSWTGYSIEGMYLRSDGVWYKLAPTTGTNATVNDVYKSTDPTLQSSADFISFF